MTQTQSHASTRRWLGSLLGVLGGLWGVTIILVFVVSLSRMIENGTPFEIVWSIDGPALAVLGLQLLGYAAGGTIALLAGLNKIHNINWLRLMLALSIVFLGLSLIPFSSIGPLNLPAAIGLLVSSLVLLTAQAGV